VISRRTTEPCELKGIKLPADFNLAIDVKSLHFDPKQWGPDANEFNPLRFSPDLSRTRHPAAYLPFGLGPRTCIGMRFAVLEIKVTLAKLLLKYDVVATKRTTKFDEFQYTEYGGIREPKYPIEVAIRPRKSFE
jgi:cytochrome P450